jgi:hypothetical protein
MDKKLLKLMIEALEDVEDGLSGMTCNDWEFPRQWSKEDRELFARTYWEAEGWPEEHDPERPSISNSTAVKLVLLKMKSGELTHVGDG